ncbi:MAG: NfeD family protein [Oscillospiraceae bacterium]
MLHYIHGLRKDPKPEVRAARRQERFGKELFGMWILFWAAVFVFFTVVEIFSVQMISIWFAFGALITMFVAIGLENFAAQLVVFIAASVVLLVSTRPLVRKLLKKTVPTNAELDVGKTATVIEEINPAQQKGRATLSGVDWIAVSEDGGVIAEGTTVVVKQIAGAKLIVSEKS